MDFETSKWLFHENEDHNQQSVRDMQKEKLLYEIKIKEAEKGSSQEIIGYPFGKDPSS